MDLARDGVDGRHLALQGNYDLIILDVMLPGVDGFEILASVREHKDTPILMLTARDAVETACAGWKAAPTTTWSSPSPFPNSSRGCRRCCAAARKSFSVLRLAGLELDLARRRAQRDGRRLDLTAKNSTCSCCCCARARCCRAPHWPRVWDMNFDSDTNVIDVAVRRLRGKLDDPFDAKLLHTVRGMGYVLESRPE